jgi:LmbE family N-acetylglucosaminyl deacetylase
VLVVAPHPDDETLGCGGTVALLARDRVRTSIVIVTGGGASHPTHPFLRAAEISSLRKTEAHLATGLLGVSQENVTFLEAEDGSLANLDGKQSKAIVGEIVKLLAKAPPDAVLLPYRGDGSSEHNATFGLVRSALREARQEARVLEYPIWAWRNPVRLVRPLLTSRTVWRAAFLELMDVKAAAIRSYVTQILPIAPDEKPVLPPDFTSEFMLPEEFLFEK